MPEPSGKLPVLKLTWAGIRMPFEQFANFARMAWAPFLLGAGLDWVLWGEIVPIPGADPAKWHLTWMSAIRLALVAAVNVPFAVGWNRLAVLGEPAVAERPPFPFSQREVRFLIASWLIAVVFFGPAALDCLFIYLMRDVAAGHWIFVLSLAAFLLFVAGFVGLVRALFILPSIAADQFDTVTDSLGQTRHSGWRLFWIMILAGLPYTITSRIMTSAYLRSNGVKGFTLGIGLLVFSYFGSAASTGAIALAYRDKVVTTPS